MVIPFLPEFQNRSVSLFLLLAFIIRTGFFILFTTVLLDDSNAGVALDVAAPVKFAITTLLHDNLLCVVTATAAQNRTAIEAGGGFIADAIQCSCVVVMMFRG